jgi:CubicO group peptidase (beta-lactamase class C family)
MRSKLIPIVSLALLLCLLSGCQWDGARRIDAVVTEEIQAGHFPGAVVLVGNSEKVLYCRAFGQAVAQPFQAPMDKDTIFDLASLTKPIATATSVMILIDRGKLSLDDRVGDYLPQFAREGKEDVRIRHLLTHSSGLPAYTNAAAIEKQHGNPCPAKVIEKICSFEAEAAPGQEFRYSCLGYITLGRIVQVVTGQSVAEFSRDNIFAPLEMKETTFNPPAAWSDRIAATEIVEGELRRGTVHDPLARLMGGTSGNAGLFASAADLSVFCRMLLNGGEWKGQRILSPAAVERLTTIQSHGRAYGFDVLSSYSWIKGPNASERTFCHSGYTGTSVVCDPAARTYVIILTNRAHPDDGGTVKAVRRGIAEIVFAPAPSQIPPHTDTEDTGV